MHLSASRLFLAALLLGLWASAASAGGQGCNDKPSACGDHCPSGQCTPCEKSESGCTRDCSSGCPAYGCPGHAGCGENGCDKNCDKEACDDDCCDEGCCDEDCCDKDCSCSEACRARAHKSCGAARCKDGDDDEEDGDDEDGGDCGDDEDDVVDNADCCQGWFFGNWFKGWGASSNKFNYTNKNCCPNGKCEKFQDAAKHPAYYSKPAEIYGGATSRPMGQNAASYNPCWSHAYGVTQTSANSCESKCDGSKCCDSGKCNCECGKCKCNHDKQAACQSGCSCPAECGVPCPPTCPPHVSTGVACPLGFCAPQRTAATHFNLPVPPPPPAPPGCPAMGPHGEMFQRMATLMAENAALHARLQAKEDWADEQECLRAALTEAREEVARLNAAQQNGSSKDQVIVEWIKAQSEASARKDEMLTEVLGAVIEMQTAKSEASAAEKLEAKVEKLEASLQQMKEENVKLKTRVSHLKRETKRVSTGESAYCPGECHSQQQAYKVEVEPIDCPNECPAECPR